MANQSFPCRVSRTASSPTCPASSFPSETPATAMPAARSGPVTAGACSLISGSSGSPQFGGAVGTTTGPNRNGHPAIGTLLRGGRRGYVSGLQPIGRSHDQEDSKGHDDEGDHVVDELTVVNGHGTGIMRLGNGGVGRRGLLPGLEHNEKIGKVETAHCQSDGRHDDVIHQRLDDGAEAAPDDDPHREIEHVAAQRKGLELLEHGCVPGSGFQDCESPTGCPAACHSAKPPRKRRTSSKPPARSRLTAMAARAPV